MSFSSVSFFVFMIAVFLIYWGIPHKFRYVLLICANIAFYSSFGAKYLLVLLFEALISYALALYLVKVPGTSLRESARHCEQNVNRSDGSNKVLIIAGIVVIVLPLLIFKYLNFAIYTVDKVLSVIAAPVSDHTLKMLAPIGISFYTFESLSYIIDVYKGKIAPERNFLKLFAFFSFFPNITSGPIERAGDFIPQLDIEKNFDYDRTVYGLRLLLLGMLKKICGADVLKQYVDAVFGNIYAYKGPTFIVAIILYTYEIYLDFSGYTDMARGLAYMLGYDLRENFKSPYLSNGIKEFFSRWHISLSQWLRDYIYIPLGGSRCSKIRKYINLMIAMLVSGLWHGANFTFIVWGLLHGVYQCAADVTIGIKKRNNNTEMQNNRIFKVLRILFTFILVSFAWMFFRANSLSDAKYIALNMFIGSNFYGQMLQMGFLKISAYISVIVIIALTIAYDLASERMDVVYRFGELNAVCRWILYIVCGLLVIVLRAHTGAGADFIYFSF